MESINPEENSSLSLKKKYNKIVMVRLDEDLFKEVFDILADDYIYNSASHFIRCAIIEKIRGKK